MILRWFIVSIAAIFIGSALLPTPDLLSGYVRDAMPSYFYMGLCSIGFVTGYMLFPGRWGRGTAKKPILIQGSEAEIPTRYMMLFAVMAMCGTAILILQIQATVGLSSYASLVLETSAGDSTTMLRSATILVPFSEGGYPGYIKMFNWSSVIALFCLLALLARGYRLRGCISLTLAFVVATMYLGGIFLRMDRLSALAVAPVLLSLVCVPGKRLRKVLGAGAILLLLVAIGMQSARRVTDRGTMEWVATYLQLGTINLALLMRSSIEHTYGLFGIVSPVAWIARSFGISLLPDPTSFDWASDPFQNGFGYMFLDFGWLAILVFLIAGSVARRIDERVASDTEGPWREVQWVFAYAVASLPVVPAYNGIEFFLQLIISVLLVRSAVNFVARKRQAAFSAPGCIACPTLHTRPVM